MNETYRLQRGSGPLLVSVPHAGTDVPAAQWARLAAPAHRLSDTDWWVDRVWEGAGALGAGLLVAQLSRYVIDLNRPPDDAPLYEGPGSGLVPTLSFAGEPLYEPGCLPDRDEVALRLARFWRPYHDALSAELGRIRERHGFAILLDAHSIKSEVPRLFEGRLPDLNLGSHGGASAAPGLVRRAATQLKAWPGCSSVVDGRFRGGYITRHYGDPAHDTHALQLEMCQAVYMQEEPPVILPDRLDAARVHANAFMRCLLEWEPGRE